MESNGEADDVIVPEELTDELTLVLNDAEDDVQLDIDRLADALDVIEVESVTEGLTESE